jgi:hypothetical protein
MNITNENSNSNNNRNFIRQMVLSYYKDDIMIFLRNNFRPGHLYLLFGGPMMNIRELINMKSFNYNLDITTEKSIIDFLAYDMFKHILKIDEITTKTPVKNTKEGILIKAHGKLITINGDAQYFELPKNMKITTNSLPGCLLINGFCKKDALCIKKTYDKTHAKVADVRFVFYSISNAQDGVFFYNDTENKFGTFLYMRNGNNVLRVSQLQNTLKNVDSKKVLGTKQLLSDDKYYAITRYSISLSKFVNTIKIDLPSVSHVHLFSCMYFSGTNNNEVNRNPLGYHPSLNKYKTETARSQEKPLPLNMLKNILENIKEKPNRINKNNFELFLIGQARPKKNNDIKGYLRLVNNKNKTIFNMPYSNINKMKAIKNTLLLYYPHVYKQMNNYKITSNH